MNLFKENMLRIKWLLPLLFFLASSSLIFAQTSYIPLGSKQYEIMDRLEIKTGNQGDYFSFIKPYSGKSVAQQAEMIDSILQTNNHYGNLSSVDRYNLQNILMDNSEWTSSRSTYKSLHPLFGKNGLYQTKDNMVEINHDKFFLSVNPVVYLGIGKEKNNSSTLYQTSYGLTLRGRIGKAIGFDFYVTNNQERDPLYVNSWITTHTAVPEQGNYTAGYTPSGNLDYVRYVDARGSVNWKVTNHIDLQFGYDRNFLGDGYRSLFLSNTSGNTLFFKINTRIWKFDYQNIFMKLEMPNVSSLSSYASVPMKFARFNELSINVNKWLNLGLFEGIIFGRTNHYDFSYMVPVLFLRPAESNTGSGDNAVIGLHAKANVAGKLQFYGQLLIDELKVHELLSGTGWWGNKNAFQLGAKYVDAFGLKNVDLQLEINQIRPYTYSHYDSVGSYTNNNQAIAHPLGANIREIVALIHAQPAKKIYIQVQAIHYLQGLDSAGVDFGSNPFLNYNLRPRDFGYQIGDGDGAVANMIAGTLSYELAENMFLELTGYYRTFKVASAGNAARTTSLGISFRWNIGRRDFNF